MVLELCQRETHGTLLQIAWNLKKKKLRTASVEEENRKLAQIRSDFLYSGVPTEIIVKWSEFGFFTNSMAILVPALLVKAVSALRSG